jgi:hypothetical protein
MIQVFPVTFPNLIILTHIEGERKQYDPIKRVK